MDGSVVETLRRLIDRTVYQVTNFMQQFHIGLLLKSAKCDESKKGLVDVARHPFS